MHLGLELVITGMGTVFAFLILLIIVTTLMSWVVKRFETSFSAISEAGVKSTDSTVKAEDKKARNPDMSSELLATIVSSAIHKHRSRSRK